ncbi:MAG: pilus assembly protein [Aquisalinus sp.]|nr:pilus assembly protein [Aquisalinus sp.]
MRELIRNFLRDTGGNFAMIAALASPVLMLLAAGTMDMARYRSSVDDIQKIADFAAIAGAREMVLANSSESSITTRVNNVLSTRMNSAFDGQTYTKQVFVSIEESEINVSISIQVNGMLGQNLFPDNGLVKADSTAVATASAKICAITLDETDYDTFYASNQASIEATGCSMYANSTNPHAVDIDRNAKIIADLMCSAGGVDNDSRDSRVVIVTDCPQIHDPLEDRSAPAIPSTCDENNFRVENKRTATVYPGRYCGGLRVKQDSTVTFMPGTYIIDSGLLYIDKRSVIKGDGVSFYFTGDGSRLFFDKGAEIEFSAPETGDMAGMLFMEDYNNDVAAKFEIFTGEARELLGTIYLPQGHLVVETSQPVGEDSAFTVIVAREIHLRKQAALYLNTDYSATKVPVPDGVGPVGGSTYLKQ